MARGKMSDVQSTWIDDVDYVHWHSENWNSQGAIARFKEFGENGKASMQKRFLTNYQATVPELKALETFEEAENLDQLIIDALLNTGFAETLQTQKSETINFQRGEALRFAKEAAACLQKGKAENSALEQLYLAICRGANTIEQNSELNSLVMGAPTTIAEAKAYLAKNAGGKTQPDGTLVTTKTMTAIQKYLVYLHNLLHTIETKGANKKELVQAISGSLNNIFNTGFGERLVLAGLANAGVIALKDLDKYLLGTAHNSKATIAHAGEALDIVNTTFKADVGGIAVTVDLQGTEIKINLGASIKQYNQTGKTFPSHVALLTGGSIINLTQSLKTDTKSDLVHTLYYLGESEANEAYAAFKAAVVLSNADRLLVGAGLTGGNAADFSHFIIINQKWIPTSQIIAKVVEQTVGSSVTGKAEEEIDDVITLSIAGAKALSDIRARYPVTDTPNLNEQERRMQEIRVAAAALTINAALHTKKLLALL